MKKLLALFLWGVITNVVTAQAPAFINYQAAIRNSSGAIVSAQSVSVQFSILNTINGSSQYTERHTATTDAQGMVNLKIGGGSVTSGSWAAISWGAGDKYLKVEVDPSGGSNYSLSGTSQLLSVPFALYANTAGGGTNSQWTTNANGIYYNSGNVGIGTASPVGKLDVSQSIYTDLGTLRVRPRTSIIGGTLVLEPNTSGTAREWVFQNYNDRFRLTTSDAAGNDIDALGASVEGNICVKCVNALGDLAIGNNQLWLFDVNGNSAYIGYNWEYDPNTNAQFNPFGFGSSAVNFNDDGSIVIANRGVRPANTSLSGGNYDYTYISPTGNWGLGTTNPQYKLDVCGNARFKEVRVQTGWCDYVFDEEYKLRPLEEVKSFIEENKHLPDVTPGPEIEAEGMEVGKTSSQMIRKIEELTLYMIDLNEKVKKLEEENKELKILLDKNTK